MRAVVWILLVLNGLAAGAWLSGITVPAQVPPEPSLPGDASAPLRLLSELPHPPPLLDSSLPELAMTGDSPLEDAQPAGQDGDSAPSVETPPQAARNVPVSAPPAASEAPHAPTSTPARASAGQTDAAEVMTEVAAASSASPMQQQEPAAAVDEPVCYRTAALSGDVYQAAGVSLRAAGFDRLDLQPLNGARPRYWVYWSGDVDQVGAIEARLKAAAVGDWYRMRMPGREARLSLGVYGQKAGARSRQRALADKGVQAQIDERYPPQAMLRWRVNAAPARVASASAALADQGVRLERCP